MSDSPTLPQSENGNGDSKILGVSIRGWLASLIVITVCGMSTAGAEVKEPLYTLAGLAVGFYFGQKTKT